MGTNGNAPSGSILRGTLNVSPGFVPLSHGRRRDTPVHIGALEPDKDPAVVLYNVLSDRLPASRAPLSTTDDPSRWLSDLWRR